MSSEAAIAARFGDWRQLQPRGGMLILSPRSLIGSATAISILLFMLNTHHGIGILPDSTRYMGINDHTWDAPLYPFALNLVAALGFGMAESARLLGLALVAANTALIAALLIRTTGRIDHAAVGTALLIALPPFVTLHATAMSEPLFLLFVLLGLFAFLRYLETERQAWLAVCGILVGLCALVRFTAPPLGAAIALTLLVNPRHGLPRRIWDAAIVSVLSAGIFLSWCVSSELTEGRSIGRELRFFGNMGQEQWLNSLRTMAAWILPDDAPLALRVGLLVTILVAGSILTVRHSRAALVRARDERVTGDLLPVTLTCFFLLYMGFMLLSTSIEANLSLNSRYAFPAYVAGALLLTIVVSRADAMHRANHRATRAFAVIAAVILTGHVARTITRTESTFRSGFGYSSVAWARSPTLARLAALPRGASLYSNGPDAIAYVIGRPAHFVPHQVLLRTGRPDLAYPYSRQLADLRRALARPSSYVVFLDRVDWRFYLATEPELVRTLGLHLIAAKSDGRIYAIQNGGTDHAAR